VPTWVLMDVRDFRTYHSEHAADLHLEQVDRREL
jgi:hypothetical protein